MRDHKKDPITWVEAADPTLYRATADEFAAALSAMAEASRAYVLARQSTYGGR